MTKLENARTLVISRVSGIGFGVARAAHAEGARVTIASTNPEKTQSAAARIGNVETARLDVTDESAVQAYFASLGG